MAVMEPSVRKLHSRLIEIVLPYIPKHKREDGEKGPHVKKSKKDMTDDEDILKCVMGRNAPEAPAREDNMTRLQEYAQIKKYTLCELLTYKIEVIQTVFPNKVKVSCICPEISEKVCEVVADNKQKGKQETTGEMLKCIGSANQGKCNDVKDVTQISRVMKNVEIINREMIEKEMNIEKEMKNLVEEKIVIASEEPARENIAKVVRVLKNTQRGNGNNRWTRSEK